MEKEANPEGVMETVCLRALSCPNSMIDTLIRVTGGCLKRSVRSGFCILKCACACADELM